MFKLVVLLSALAFAAAKPSAVLPLAYSYGGWPAVSSVSQYSVHGSYVPSVYSAAYPAVVGAWAQPPHSPAVVLDPVNGVPLDTPEVVAARAAHYQAKALAGHSIAKRSVTPLAYSSVVSPVAGLVSPYSYATPYTTPYVSAYSSPYVSPYWSSLAYPSVVPKAFSVHPY